MTKLPTVGGSQSRPGILKSKAKQDKKHMHSLTELQSQSTLIIIILIFKNLLLSKQLSLPQIKKIKVEWHQSPKCYGETMACRISGNGDAGRRLTDAAGLVMRCGG